MDIAKFSLSSPCCTVTLSGDQSSLDKRDLLFFRTKKPKTKTMWSMTMIEYLPVIERPQWLSDLDPKYINYIEFPLEDVLRDSLYYPSSGFDGTPVRHFLGNVFSFVYVDYGNNSKELDEALAKPGFRGYEVIAKRDITEKELVPNGWQWLYTRDEIYASGNPLEHCSWLRSPSPFCSWIIFQRKKDAPVSHGPHRFSLLYLCADGVAAFQALYVCNEMAPACVAIIQPGHGFGTNWTCFNDPDKIFARSVLENPAGKPKVILYGGNSGREYFSAPCWPDDYPNLLCFLSKGGRGNVGVWK